MDDTFQRGLALFPDSAHVVRHQDFIDAVTSNPQLETFFVNPKATGMSVTLKKRKPIGK